MAYSEDIGYGGGFNVFSENEEHAVLVGVDKPTADYAVMLLEAGVQASDVKDMADRAECTRCGDQVFVGELDSADRCAECQS
jgi:hypothetical protein